MCSMISCSRINLNKMNECESSYWEAFCEIDALEILKNNIELSKLNINYQLIFNINWILIKKFAMSLEKVCFDHVCYVAGKSLFWFFTINRDVKPWETNYGKNSVMQNKC